MKRLFTLALLCLTGFSHAGQLADIQIIDHRTQQVLETWSHRGNLYVAGQPGSRYTVRINNKSGGRILTVLSVDGVNAVSGETAHPSQPGYVLGAWQGTQVAGWRKSLDEVAAFYFTSLGDSYAARTDRPQNVGVIGVAVFNEYQAPRAKLQLNDANTLAQQENQTSDAPRAAAPAKAEARAGAPLGTGHGERLASHVTTTEFQRASEQPAEIIRIYYDSRANLIARGIIPNPVAARPRPDPFPGSFVPDPKG